ncbi:uncharacterized protein ANIA_11276 [Aspergillus nidulans FGSC A4]|uniref:Uncharacterized protein n=1 Tax=Emericella nidulans (strain FGSC A4 / ATCC 38163 / CBS 112.46 / NRRL 194 / M139) TaxID=227321 RepID=C8VSC5_EMENI|nr:hypothetical protein [Aspergillus nidulans FGSC A4]CBF89186.1 TPA: hypothetical protein ANIA_11276 [Aspergillus nidulans FGSC A4]
MAQATLWRISEIPDLVIRMAISLIVRLESLVGSAVSNLAVAFGYRMARLVSPSDNT